MKSSKLHVWGGLTWPGLFLFLIIIFCRATLWYYLFVCETFLYYFILCVAAFWYFGLGWRHTVILLFYCMATLWCACYICDHRLRVFPALVSFHLGRVPLHGLHPPGNILIIIRPLPVHYLVIIYVSVFEILIAFCKSRSMVFKSLLIVWCQGSLWPNLSFVYFFQSFPYRLVRGNTVISLTSSLRQHCGIFSYGNTVILL